MSITVTIKCHKHPRYLGVYVNTVNCSGCHAVYGLRRALSNYNKPRALSGTNGERLDRLREHFSFLRTKLEPWVTRARR